MPCAYAVENCRLKVRTRTSAIKIFCVFMILIGKFATARLYARRQTKSRNFRHQPSFYFGSASKLHELTRIRIQSVKIRGIRVRLRSRLSSGSRLRQISARQARFTSSGLPPSSDFGGTSQRSRSSACHLIRINSSYFPTTMRSSSPGPPRPPPRR